MEELNEIEAKIRQGLAVIRTRPFDAELFISEALYMISLINERAQAEHINDASALPIHSVSGWVSVDDVANPMPNIEGLQIMFESGTYIDYDAKDWPHEIVTHWRNKPCR